MGKYDSSGAVVDQLSVGNNDNRRNEKINYTGHRRCSVSNFVNPDSLIPCGSTYAACVCVFTYTT